MKLLVLLQIKFKKISKCVYTMKV